MFLVLLLIAGATSSSFGQDDLRTAPEIGNLGQGTTYGEALSPDSFRAALNSGTLGQGTRPSAFDGTNANDEVLSEVTPRAAPNTGTLTRLKADVVAAFDKIAASKSFRLLPGLSLDRIPGVTEAIPSTAPRNGKDFSLSEVYRRAEGIFKTHSLFWNVLPGVDLTVSENKEGDFNLGVTECRHNEESRTFKLGMRRMKLVLLPIMYKLGVITTLLTLLTVFALKGLTIGVLLLIMSSAGLVAKLKWAHHGYGYPHTPGKEVHVHVHGGGHHYGGASHYDEWVREDRPMPPPLPPPVHRIPHHIESTASPWASYIGERSL